MPVSGITGQGIKTQIDDSTCPWYDGPAFIPFIDDLPSLNRKTDGPFIMPIVDKYKDMGTVVMGKVESGTAKKGQNLLVMPNRVSSNEARVFQLRNNSKKFFHRHKFRSISFGQMRKKSRPSVPEKMSKSNSK
jgi:translation elongation factor EF-1alpha